MKKYAQYKVLNNVLMKAEVKTAKGDFRVTNTGIKLCGHCIENVDTLSHSRANLLVSAHRSVYRMKSPEIAILVSHLMRLLFRPLSIET